MEKNHKVSRISWSAAIIIIFAMAAVLFPAVCVRAADANLFLQNYDTEEGKVVVNCASLSELGEGLGAEQFAAMISGQECPVLGVSTVKQEQEGITYYCLVDVSGSMHQDQMEQAKAVLGQLCEGLGERDNMVIGALGTALETTDFLTDKEEISAAIDGLMGDSDYTAIHDAMLESISVLQSNNNCNRKKCLILISDGVDETVIGKTRDEVVSAITSSKIPVYTVAALRQSFTDEQKESAENLGAFARQSSGGRDYAPVAEGFDAKEAGRLIVEDMQNGLILTVDTSKVEATKDEVLLNVRLETGDATYNDTMYLYAADLKFGAEPEPTTEPPTEPEPTTEEVTEPPTEPEPSPDGIPLPVIIGAAAAVLILIIIIILVVMRNKARKEAEEKAAAEKEAAEREAAAKAEQERREKEQREAEQREMEARKRAQEEAKKKQQDLTRFQANIPVGSVYEVKFIAIDHEEVTFTLNIPEEKTVTVGRNRKADLVLNPEDKHLSSVQCKVHCMQNVMNVWDMNSQNGTFVNGVPIRQIGMATVQNGDVMRMGSYEYRVFITKR